MHDDHVHDADEQGEGGHEVWQCAEQLGLGQQEEQPHQPQHGGRMLARARRKVAELLEQILRIISWSEVENESGGL